MVSSTSSRRPLSPRGVAIAACIGTTIEWYDYYIFGTMAVLYFGPLFFPGGDPVTGFLLAVSAVGVAYVARPFGGLVFSHFGDKVGRKNVLLFSILLMGAATFCVGLLPTYDRIGIWAPILLVSLRFIQGLSAGGEWGGAVLLAVEKAPAHRRALYGSSPSAGVQLGLLSASLMILLVQQLPDAVFNSYGWRVPFLVSVVPLAIGLVIRSRINESEHFLDAKGGSAVPPKIPLAEVLRKHWRVVLASTGFIFLTHAGYIIFSFLPGWATNVRGMDARWSTIALLVAGVTGLLVLALVATKVDGRDRRKFTGSAGVLAALYAFPSFALVMALGPVGLIMAMSAGFAILSIHNSALPSLLADQFPVLVRYTGISLSYQLSAVLAGGLLPVLTSYLVSEVGSYWPAAVVLIFGGLVTVVGSSLAKRAEVGAGAAGTATSAATVRRTAKDEV